MKKLLELIKELSNENDIEKRNNLRYEINLLIKQLTDKKLVSDIQKIYNSK